MRILKSLLVALIGLSSLLYAIQNLANIDEMRGQLETVPSQAADGAHPLAIFSPGATLAVSWIGFGLVTLCQLVIAAVAFKGAWDLFAARNGTAEEFREAKSTAVWAGGLSLLTWFGLFLMIGSGLFPWGTLSGAVMLAKIFELGTTSALTILFVWGTRD